MYEKRIVHQ